MAFAVVTGHAIAQEYPDSIITATDQVIPCKISMINNQNVFFKSKRKTGHISLIDVKAVKLNSMDAVLVDEEAAKELIVKENEI